MNNYVLLLRRASSAREESPLLLSSCLEEFFARIGLPPVPVVKDALGKPVFADPDFPYHLSLTHTDSLFAAVFAPFPIGVDAEPLTALRPRIAGRYFTPEEAALPFADVWTAREALSKCTGRGLSDALAATFDGKNARLGSRLFAVEHSETDAFRIAVAYEI